MRCARGQAGSRRTIDIVTILRGARAKRLLVLALLALSPGTLAARAQQEVTETSHFLFKAPRNLTGLFTARLRFEWGGENTCSGVLAASGPRVSPNPVHF